MLLFLADNNELLFVIVVGILFSSTKELNAAQTSSVFRKLLFTLFGTADAANEVLTMPLGIFKGAGTDVQDELRLFILD